MSRSSSQDMSAVRHSVCGCSEPKALLRGLSQGRETTDIPRLRALRPTVRAGRSPVYPLLLASLRLCAPQRASTEAQAEAHSAGYTSAEPSCLPREARQPNPSDDMRAVRREAKDRSSAQGLSRSSRRSVVVCQVSSGMGSHRTEGRHNPSIGA